MPLIVPIPPPGVARLRFTTTAGDIGSKLIRADTRSAVSHVECVVDAKNGGTIVAAQPDAGVQNRPIDYDSWSTTQIFVDLTMPQSDYDRWIQFLWNYVGRSFDSGAFFGFVLPFIDAHREGAVYCSSFVTASLRYSHYFPNWLALRYHQISPVVVLLMLQAQPKDRAKIHDVEKI